MIAILVIPHIKIDLEHHYYFIPYLVAASALFVATLLFLIGWPYYIHVQANETVITKCIPVFINACQSWYTFKKNKYSKDKERASGMSMNALDVSHSPTEIEDSISIQERSATFLDFAKAPNNGKFSERIVDDVKSLRGALVVFTLLVPFWLVYNQVK